MQQILVKQVDVRSRWIWGAFKMPGLILSELEQLWRMRDRQDEYFGTLVNAWLAQGGEARGIKAGDIYVDAGTPEGYRKAVAILQSKELPVA